VSVGPRCPRPHSDNVKLALVPEHDSGVSGSASFEEISEGVSS